MKNSNNVPIDKRVDDSVRFIRTHTTLRPNIAVILGSGLGDFADALSGQTTIETKTIPHYPVSTVVGHKGKLVFGRLGTIPLLVFQGRVHFYETGTLETVLFPIRVAHGLGIKTLLMTNAAGGVNKSFKPGDLMVIEDQVNLTFENPMRNRRYGMRDAGYEMEDIRSSMSDVGTYDKSLQKIIVSTAKHMKISLQQGVYMGVKGPSYETAAEIRMARDIGADAVGMSTVNEASLAVALGIRVAGISCITNLATGITSEKLSHAEVTDVANMVKKKFSGLLTKVISNF